jgi:hypothetical protein
LACSHPWSTNCGTHHEGQRVPLSLSGKVRTHHACLAPIQPRSSDQGGLWSARACVGGWGCVA